MRTAPSPRNSSRFAMGGLREKDRLVRPLGGRTRFRGSQEGLGARAAGAGEGNRTLVVSLGSFCSAIELHPRFATHFTPPGRDSRRLRAVRRKRPPLAIALPYRDANQTKGRMAAMTAASNAATGLPKGWDPENF